MSDPAEGGAAAPPAIGIDVGGTKIAGGVVDGQGRILARRQIPSDPRDTNALVVGIVKVARELIAAAPAVSGVGIGAAALVDADQGIVLYAPNLPWRALPLARLVEDRVGLPVALDNDANAAAWGEATHGAGAGCRHLLALTVGTGIGGGLILDGRLYRGARWLAAEVGHMVVAPGGPACNCGNEGCLEALASGTAIGRMARERIGAHPDSTLLAGAGGDPDAIVGELVTAAASEGDPLAKEVLAEAGRWLGIGLANLVNVFDPEKIIVGGGAAAGAGEMLLTPARERMGDLIVGGAERPPVPVLAARLGASAGIIGAAALTRSSPPVLGPRRP